MAQYPSYPSVYPDLTAAPGMTFVEGNLPPDDIAEAPFNVEAQDQAVRGLWDGELRADGPDLTVFPAAGPELVARDARREIGIEARNTASYSIPHRNDPALNANREVAVNPQAAVTPERQAQPPVDVVDLTRRLIRIRDDARGAA